MKRFINRGGGDIMLDIVFQTIVDFFVYKYADYLKNPNHSKFRRLLALIPTILLAALISFFTYILWGHWGGFTIVLVLAVYFWGATCYFLWKIFFTSTSQK
ncbi:hypothetical protein [Lacticaseibacillus saniviri]|uniref:Uncharacterized protein n=2 Tax=Lacticaseibacillus saniviri TaxID=931533 RepID=A0A0R2MV92_9LACO|nr:hypothetical protein [Lacticaseibacillus saniviri]KRO15741.1 hypothetical protein IV56_GL002163 [Lacticaseibacillus saniviri JCM 17471 = DSM 24301]MCG4281607.1 hypothetical protein [Lacticaseibacillus saniviri]